MNVVFDSTNKSQLRDTPLDLHPLDGEGFADIANMSSSFNVTYFFSNVITPLEYKFARCTSMDLLKYLIFVANLFLFLKITCCKCMLKLWPSSAAKILENWELDRGNAVFSTKVTWSTFQFTLTGYVGWSAGYDWR